MAGFDLDTQRSAQLAGCRMDFGQVTFDADSATAEVPTTLERVFYGAATIKKATDDNITEGVVAVCDNDISSTGNVTFTRISPNTTTEETYNYVLMGY